jgi:hypothetical protein
MHQKWKFMHQKWKFLHQKWKFMHQKWKLNYMDVKHLFNKIILFFKFTQLEHQNGNSCIKNGN